MHEKLNIYDITGVLVPGTLVVAAIPLGFPVIIDAVAEPKFPDVFLLIVLTALSIFMGHLIQAFASIIEPFLYKTWGGRPSEKALDHGLGDRYFPASSGARIRAKLADVAEPNASTRSLFLIAMQRAESSDSPRVSTFNALFAYHRALVVMSFFSLVIFVASFHDGVAARLSWKQNTAICVLLIGLLVLFWHRAKQRGVYYVREVLLCAEQNLLPAK